MIVNDVVSRVRKMIDDTIEPHLIATELLVDEVDRAQRIFAERTLCLFTSGEYELSVSAGQAFVDLPPEFMQLRRITTNEHRLVELVTSRHMDEGFVQRDYGLQHVSDWQTLEGRPRFAVTDLRTGAIRLSPVPTEPLTLSVSAYLFPETLTSTDDELQIPERWQMDLAQGVLAELYSSHDFEVHDPHEANRFYSLWERTLREARAQINKQFRGPGVVQFSRTGVW